MGNKKIIESLLDDIGIKINGPRPYDIQVHNEDFYARVLRQGSLGLGESYMDGWWDSERVDELIYRLVKAKSQRISWALVWVWIKAKLTNRQSKSRAFQVGEQHYDVGNDLFELMLDKRLNYSCGYWKDANNLDDAQEAKLDLICRKMGLKPGMRVLDIGSGWGSFLEFAAEKYGINGVGITISKEQVEYSKKRVANLPLEIRLQDYRQLNEKFDRIISIGMFEHVGYKNYKAFMQIVNRNLSDDGLFLLHTIASNHTVYQCDPWFDKYIFPNGMLPSIKQIGGAIEKVFVMEDWHNFGADYDKTLMAWHKNFTDNWDKIKHNYDDRFRRMWDYYILSVAGDFRARDNQLWQIVLSKKGVPGGYISVR